MKDNFSERSDFYSKYRPTYPDELIEFIISQVQDTTTAWDCATGNGQMAVKLAKHFSKIYATDISNSQLSMATQKNNIEYKAESVEHSSLSDSIFDLITVAQAIHWFNFEKFYAEALRTSKPNGVIAIVGYSLIKINTPCDIIIYDFYKNVLGKYWDPERRYVDEEYKTIPFPFREIQVPNFNISLELSLDELTGYFNSWSAVQHYIKQNNQNPVNEIRKSLNKFWKKNERKKVVLPIISRIGRIEK